MRKLTSVGLVTVTFIATAVVPAGRLGTVRVTLWPAPTLAGVPPVPVPERVSNTRTGVVPVNPAAGAEGVTEFEGADGREEPAGLVAVTVNVYAVPLVNPVTVEVVLRPFWLRPPQAAHAGVGMIV